MHLDNPHPDHVLEYSQPRAGFLVPQSSLPPLGTTSVPPVGLACFLTFIWVEPYRKYSSVPGLPR